MKPARLAAIGGCLALFAALLGGIGHSRQFLESYLYAFLFWIHLPLGGLALLLIYPLTGGSWGASTRRILEALSDTLRVLALFAIPFLLSIGRIYPWMQPEVAAETRIAHKAAYLNPAAFALRLGLYFACWLWLNRAVQRRSASLEEGGDPRERGQLRRIAAGGLVLYGLTATFAAIDWQMSLEPRWYSTVYGMVYVTGQALSSYSFTLIVFGAAAGRRDFPRKTLRDLGNLLLTLVTVWTYLAFIQYLIIWSGNLPHEVTWFIHRTRGGWQWVLLPIVVFQFAIPFFVLLFQAAKGTPARLAALGALVFAVRGADQYWMVLPGLHPGQFVLLWQAVALWVGLGGIWLSFFLGRLQKHAPFAQGDPDWPSKLPEEELQHV